MGTAKWHKVAPDDNNNDNRYEIIVHTQFTVYKTNAMTDNHIHSGVHFLHGTIIPRTLPKAPCTNQNNSSINQESLKININTASKEELQTLSGIGSSKAEDIIKYREKSGLFKNISEITKVSGIGQTLYEKIKDSITI